MARNILIIDDEASIRKTLGSALKDEGYKVTVAENGPKGLELIRKERPDSIILDIWMPEMDGIEVLKRIKAEFPEIPVVMLSGHGSVETAVKATKFGAFDFLEKPPSLEKLLVILQNMTQLQDLTRENVALRRQVEKARTLIGESAGMKQIQELIRRVGPTTGSVLITGENGTGKELVAHSIHAASQRFNRPFVEVNCAAIPENLIESELFGYEPGAFSGASEKGKKGRFDLAHSGTLFLDEIGDMSLATQAKVLRILQEQKFERVGGTKTIQVDVRVIAATNKDLKDEIKKGNFREDLYYRLNVVPVIVPPLRDRTSDIPKLAPHFLKEFSKIHAKPERQIQEEALHALQTYPWPGNVRELRNLVERLVILTAESDEKRPITAADVLLFFEQDTAAQMTRSALDSHSAISDSSSEIKSLKEQRAVFEKQVIAGVLERFGGNVSKAAQALAVERSHLHKKMKDLGISAKDARDGE